MNLKGIDLEDEPSPMTYVTLPSQGTNKEPLKEKLDQKRISQANLKIDKNKPPNTERNNKNIEKLVQRKVEDEFFEEPRERVLSRVETTDKANSKRNSNSKLTSNRTTPINKNSLEKGNKQKKSDSILGGSLDDDMFQMERENEMTEIQNAPNPTVSVASKRHTHTDAAINLANNPEYTITKLRSDKSVGVLSDTSLRPRKGDKTPKSNISEQEENDHNNYISNNLSEKTEKIDNLKVDLNDNLKKSPKKENNKSPLGRKNLNANNKNNSVLTPNHNQLREKNISMIDKTSLSQLALDKNFNQYDVQQLSYDLVKEYSHLKIDKDETFMRRMLFDVFKRQTKEERMNKLLDRNKVKIDENERIKTFNRLIEDANRRLEAQEKIEMMKNKLDENSVGSKKYKFDEWEEIYENRFIRPNNEKERKIQQKVLEKVEREKQNEEEILEGVKTKKAPQYVIDQTVKRMYDEAERRKLKFEEHRRKPCEGDQDFNESMGDNFRFERELSPSKFNKFKRTQNYNFQSDMSGNEKSCSEEEKIKKGQSSLSKEKSKHVSKKLSSNFPVSVSERLYQPVKNKSNFRNKKYETNTEINNKRFDRDNLLFKSTGIIREENQSSNYTPINIPDKENNIKKTNSRYIIDEHLKILDKEIFHNEEDEVRNVPKPIMANLKEKVKLNDFKSIKTKSLNSNQYQNSSNLLYMPDFVATKLVNEIIQKKLNE